MSNGPKKITELPVANTYANTDLVLLVGNVSTNATTFSVTPAVLFANVNATRINVGNTVNVGANSIINATAHFITSNSTVNAIMTATSLTFSNTTAVPFTANVTGVFTTGTVNAGANSIINATAHFITSNSTVNAIMTATSLTFSNTTAVPFTANVTGVFTTGTVNATSHTVGSNFIANSTATTIAANTLTLGTSTIAANGYSYLPNGLKINFGVFVANTTSQVTFTSAFAAAVVSILVTPANTVYIAANVPYVFTSNTTTANIYSASTTTSSNCYYVAIGY
jgi:hypothetical protein